MKILLVCHSFPPTGCGGTEIYSYNLARELLIEGHEVYVVHRSFSDNFSDYSIQIDEFEGIFIFKINKFLFNADFIETYQDGIIDKLFNSILDLIKPDVVHVNHLMLLSFGIVDLIKEKKIPIVLTLHDYWLLCPQIHLHKKYLLCTAKNISDCAVCIRKLGFIYNEYYILERDMSAIRVLSAADIIISPSTFLKDKFIQLADLKDIKIIHLKNGISCKSVTRREFSNCSTGKRITLGFFGNIIEPKGLHVLLRSFEMLDKSLFDLKIFGKSDSEYASFLDITYPWWRQHYYGGYNNNDVIELMNSIDVLIFPSIIYENYPTVINEAFCAGVPVLSVDNGGAVELIQPGKNGLLFENLNPYDLKIQIEKLSHEFVNSMKENLLSFEPYSFKRHLRDLSFFYISIIGNAKYYQVNNKTISTDIFSMIHYTAAKQIVSYIFVDEGCGFNENHKLKKDCSIDEDGRFQLYISIATFKRKYGIRFVPSENKFCRCKIMHVETDGSYKGIKFNNAKTYNDEWDFFYTKDPSYIFDGDFSESTWIKISGKIEIMSNNDLIEYIYAQTLKGKIKRIIKNTWIERLLKMILSEYNKSWYKAIR